MNSIVTVIGDDRIGIIAGVTAKLAELGVNILDISQTILHGNFTMIMSVSLEKSEKPFAEIATELSNLGKKMNLSIRMQREDIFDAMYNI